jgi:multiple antibiotic resistance protein
MAESTLPLPVLGSLLFTLMGPLAVIPLFARVADGADAATRRKIAFTAYAAALVTLALAVFVGAGAMAAAGTTPSALIIAAGLILTLTALRNILGAAAPPEPLAAAAPPPSAALGFSPIAIPGLVTPMSVAVLIIFVSYFPATADKLAIMGAVLAIMTLNLGAMFAAGWFMRVIGPAPLMILGAVFGVLQAAMGVQMLISGLMRSPLLS